MARIEEADIDRVKRTTDLVALVRSRGIELKKHGSKDWKGLCPFHGDQDTPNFIVSPGKGLFHCMACGKAGNAIQFVQEHDGVSFRHAFELLDQGGAAAYQARPQIKQSSVPVLPCPLDAGADDAALTAQVAAYYHERLKQSPPALDYLASRGLNDPALIDKYQLGFADRSLGLRMPESNRKEGEALRARLVQLGLWRESGHEHFNGCIVVPLWQEGKIVSFYGRRIAKGTVNHLYPPGPHRGLFNPEAFRHDEVILCEAVLDALTFCAHGITNVSTLYGTEGFTDELAEALKPIRRVKLAYDADEAGERAAARDAERLRALGVEVWRIKFPWGMDVNEYARKVTPAGKSLALLVNAAAWMVQGRALDPRTDAVHPLQDTPGVDSPSSPMARPSGCADAQSVSALPAGLGSSLLAADVSRSEEKPAAKKENPQPSPICVHPCPSVVENLPLDRQGEGWFLVIDGREYRVTGLEKTLGADHLKVGLRVQMGERFHLDQVDLMRDAERRRFIERAAEELGLTPDLLKRDLARVLLAVESAQAQLMKPADHVPVAVELSPEEKAAAMHWLREPGLIDRLKESFHRAGIIGEDHNTLVAYLAGVSRKLERPLAIIIQSASAAGKTTLMDAVLSFFPEEERVKYSAMTGQSLYYLGETNLKHKILAVVEEAGAEKAAYALKLLQSEGELTIASTGKDPDTGRMVTQEYRVEGPVMIFITTTAIDIDEELMNRCLVLTVDESAEQTARIHQVQRERRTLAGLIAKEERKDVLALLKNAQRLLAPLEVLNPYATALTFPSGRTRNRRDHEKYLTLIDAIALLHQHQRARGTREVRGRIVEYIEVTLDDIALANELAPEVLGRSLDELPPQTRRLLEAIRELMRAKGKKHGPGSTWFSRRELKDRCGWSLTQVRVHLARLVELEYIAPRSGRMGSVFHYELLIDAEGPDHAAAIGLIEVAELRKTCTYDANLAGSNGHLAGGGGPTPARPKARNGKALSPTWRPGANAHQEAASSAAAA
jgi:DNA primase catalytic core